MFLPGLLLSFAGHSRSETHAGQSFSSQLILTKTVVWAVTRCFFKDISSAGSWSGAIWADGSLSGNYIEDTTILNCRTTHSSGVGGAIALNAPNTTIQRVCARDCYADRGPFLFFRQNPKLRELSVLRCAPPTDGASYGAITADGSSAVTILDLENGNFTQCFLRVSAGLSGYGPEGAAIMLVDSSIPVNSVRYVNFVQLNGQTGIRCNNRVLQVDYCNFVGNANSCVVWADEYGDITLTSCYFKNNTGEYVNGWWVAGAKITVSGCYIDKPSSSAVDQWTVLSSNYFNAVFTTYPIQNFQTTVCGVPSGTDPFTAPIIFRQKLHLILTWRFLVPSCLLST